MALARPGPQATTGGFLDWWLGELRALLPRRWRETAQRRFGVVLVLERPYLRVYERRGLVTVAESNVQPDGLSAIAVIPAAAGLGVAANPLVGAAGGVPALIGVRGEP